MQALRRKREAETCAIRYADMGKPFLIVDKVRGFLFSIAASEQPPGPPHRNFDEVRRRKLPFLDPAWEILVDFREAAGIT
jgi:hypothetical protein